MYVYTRSIYLSIYLSLSLSLYIYIYTHVCVYIYIYIHIYIYIYIYQVVSDSRSGVLVSSAMRDSSRLGARPGAGGRERERERGRERERERERKRGREREGPRFRVTTVLWFAAPRTTDGLVRLQLPCAPLPRWGRPPLASPLGSKHNKIRYRAQGWSPRLLLPLRRAAPGCFLGVGDPPKAMMVLAPLATPLNGSPGIICSLKGCAPTAQVNDQGDYRP